MLSLEFLAEQRIAEAQARGEFDDLPGRGQPLELDDDPLVPEDLRIAHRILKNAGFVPPEVESLRQIAELERLIEAASEPQEKGRAAVRLNLLLSQLDSGRPTRAHAQYRGQLLSKLCRR